jgi:hypothetical protein
MNNVKSCFQAAVEVLVADGRVKDRLSRAFEEHLEALNEVELPAAIRAEYASLFAAMHRERPVGPQNSVRATVQKMSAYQAAQHAASIVEMFVQLASRSGRSDPLRVGDSPKPAESLQGTEPLQFNERAVAAAPRYLTKAP